MILETLSIGKADTGGFVGHSAVHPARVAQAQQRIDEVKGSSLIDGRRQDERVSSGRS